MVYIVVVYKLVNDLKPTALAALRQETSGLVTTPPSEDHLVPGPQGRIYLDN